MFKKSILLCFCAFYVALSAKADDGCAFQYDVNNDLNLAVGVTPRENPCPPGEIVVRIPSEEDQDIVISWANPLCTVSGFRVYLRAADGHSGNFKSGFCNETHIVLQRTVVRYFSYFNIEAYSILVRDYEIISPPSKAELRICPARDPEAPRNVHGELSPDSSVNIWWTSTESLWPINYYLLRVTDQETKNVREFQSRAISYQIPNNVLLDKWYLLELSAVSITAECKESRGIVYKNYFNGKSIIKNFDVTCGRDASSLFFELTWNISPEQLKTLNPAHSFSFRTIYKANDKEIILNSTKTYSVKDTCNADGACSLTVRGLITIDRSFQFVLIAKLPGRLDYISERTQENKCYIKTRVPTPSLVIADVTDRYPEKLTSPDHQRVLQIERGTFRETDGEIVKAIVVIGDINEMSKPLGHFNTQQEFNANGKLLPVRVTPDEWNIFAAWNYNDEKYDDPYLKCEWLYGHLLSYIALCKIGIENCKQDGKSCNGALLANTSYAVRIRGCTSAGCSDTPPYEFYTGNKKPQPTPDDDDDYDLLRLQILLGLIGSLISGGLVLVITVVLLLKWNEKREMHREQRFRVVTISESVESLQNLDAYDARSADVLL